MNDWQNYLPDMCVKVPALGSDLVEAAQFNKVPVIDYIGKLLLDGSPRQVSLSVTAGRKQPFAWVSGHGLSYPRLDQRGPRRHFEVAIIGKCLGMDEVKRQYLFAGKSGKRLRSLMKEAGIPTDYDGIYVTNLLKTLPLQPRNWKVAWVRQQEALLFMELLTVRPAYVLGLGREVCEWIRGRKDKISEIEGQWFDIEWDARTSEEEEVTDENTYRFKLLPCMHPAALEYEEREEDIIRIRDTLKQLAGVIAGEQEARSEVISVEYPVIRDAKTLKQFFEKAAAGCWKRLIAVDAEWQGEHPQNAGSYLRCIQFAYAPGEAATLVLNDADGQPCFVGSDGLAGPAAIEEASGIVLQAFRENRFRVAGYFFPADLEWLRYFGFDLLPWYEPADSAEKCKEEGGFALELAVAAVDELSRNDLDSVRWRYTNIPRYEHELREYVKHHKADSRKAARSKSASDEDIEWAEVVEAGYGWIPDEVLLPYAAADADVTLRATMKIYEHLNSDINDCDCWLPYYNALRASPVAAEIMQVGLPVDVGRLLELAIPYKRKYDELLNELRRILNWPSWNIDSPQQVVEAMYGRKYSTKFVDSVRTSVRPDGAKTMALVPVLDNDSRSPQEWEHLEKRGVADTHTPGTNAKTIGVIVNDPSGVRVRRFDTSMGRFCRIRVPSVKGLETIRDIRALGQLRKTFVGKYETSIEDGKLVRSWTKGLAPLVCDDGYLRCFISQIKETARWSASRPNLHAMPKRKEARYASIMGEHYPGAVRSWFKAPPGWAIIEADYVTAELFMLAVASGDENLWDHCQRSLLDQSDPDFIDIHSSVAVSGLKFDCRPTKKGLASIGRSHFRDIAKCYASGEFISTHAGWMAIDALVGLFLDSGSEEKSAVVQEGDIDLESDLVSELTPLVAVHAAGVKKVFSIRSELGYELRVSAEHESFVLRKGEIVKKRTDEIHYEDYLIIRAGSHSDDLEMKQWVWPDLAVAIDRCCGQMPDSERAVLIGFLAGTSQFSNVGQLVKGEDDEPSLTYKKSINRKHVQLQLLMLQGLQSKQTLSLTRGSITGFTEDAVNLFELVEHLRLKEIPREIFLWSYSDRVTFLAGLLMAGSCGSARWPMMVGEGEYLRRLQQLFLSVGLYTAREKHTLSPRGSVCCEFWVECVRGNWAGAKQALTGNAVEAAMLPAGRIRQWYNLANRRAAGPYQRCYLTRSAAIQLLTEIDRKKDNLDENQAEQAAYMRSLLDSGFIFDKVRSVDSIGEQECYDIQTTSQRDHAVISGGILSSNSIVFGWAYGRQAPAIVIQAKEEGIVITLEEAEAVVDALYKQYPDAAEYLDEASKRVEQGFLCTPMGRYRRCPVSTDDRTKSKYGREFKNSPIQGGVADVVNIAGDNLRQVRRETAIPFYIAMQVHDAYLFLVQCKYVRDMFEYVIPEAMSRRVPIVPRTLSGMERTDLVEKYMSVEADLYFRWGVKPTEEELRQNNIDPKSLRVK